MSIDVRFSRLSAVLMLVAGVLAHPIAAQAPMQEAIDVRITNVEVFATDAKGNHIPGLTRDDFELYENGKLQPITNLFEASAGGAQEAAGSAAGPRLLVLYLDDSTLLPNNRKQLIPAMKKFVADVMTPQDQMMVVTFNQSLKVRLPWTNDVAALQTVLDSIGREVGGGTLRQAARGRIENDIRNVVRADQAVDMSESKRRLAETAPDADFRVLLSSVRNYASSLKYDFGLSSAALESLFGSLAGIDGPKIVFVASESFPIRPGSDMFAHLETVRNQIISGNGSEGLKREARSTSVAGAASEFNMNESILMLARVANASGVTIYALDPDIGGRSDSGNVQQMGSEMQIDATTAATAGATGVDGLQIMAAATGGLAWIGMKPTVAFEKLRADLENYYSIGYQSKASDDEERAIEVKPKRANMRVRTKKSVVFRTAEAATSAPATSNVPTAKAAASAPATLSVPTAESDMTDRVTSNLRSAEFNDLEISIKVAGEVVTEGDKKRVPVHVIIPASNLMVAAEGDVLTGGFSVYVCTAGGTIEPSDVNRQSHQIRWPPAAIEQLKDRLVTYALEVVMDKGRNQISIGVLDHRSQATGFSKIEL